MGDACRAFAGERFTFERSAAALLEWCRSPSAAADRDARRQVSIGLLSEPKAMSRMLEAYLEELRLGQVLYRSVRWLGRRALHGVGRARRGARRDHRRV